MQNLMLNIYFKGLAAKEKLCRTMVKENGEANIIAIILVIAIVVALAIIFKDKITSLFNQIWSSITSKTSTVIK